MMSKSKETIEKALQLTEENVKRIGHGAEAENSETHRSLDNACIASASHQSATSTQKESPKNAALSQKLVSMPAAFSVSVPSALEHSKFSVDSPALTAETPVKHPATPFLFSVPLPHVPVAAALSSEAVKGEEKLTITTPPVTAAKVVSSPEANASHLAPYSALRSRTTSAKSLSSAGSIAFSGMDTTLSGTSIRFVSEENSPDLDMVKKEGCTSGVSTDEHKDDAPHVREPRVGSRNDVGHYTAAANHLQRNSSAVIFVEDDEPTREAVAQPEVKKKAPRYVENVRKTSGKRSTDAAKLFVPKAIPEAPNRQVASAVQGIRHSTEVVPSAGLMEDDIRACRSHKAPQSTKARERRTSEHHSTTSPPSKRNAKAPQPPYQWASSLDANVQVHLEPTSSRSSSRSSTHLRASKGVGNSLSDSISRNFSHNKRRCRRGFRLTPDRAREEHINDDDSLDAAHGQLGGQRFHDPEALSGCPHWGPQGSLARAKEKGGHTRHSHTSAVPADYYGGPGSSRTQRRPSSSRSSAHRRGSQHAVEEKLDAWALVQKSLMEAAYYSREDFWGRRSPQSRRCSAEGPQQRVSSENGDAGKRRNDALPEGRVGFISEKTTMDKYKTYDCNAHVPQHDDRAKPHRYHSRDASRLHQPRFNAGIEAWRQGPPSDDSTSQDRMLPIAEGSDGGSGFYPVETAVYQDTIDSPSKWRPRRWGDQMHVDRHGSSSRQHEHPTLTPFSSVHDTKGREVRSASARFNELSKGESRNSSEAGPPSPSGEFRISSDPEDGSHHRSLPQHHDNGHRRSAIDERVSPHRREGSFHEQHDNQCLDELNRDHSTDPQRERHSVGKGVDAGPSSSRSVSQRKMAPSSTRESPLRTRFRVFRGDVERKTRSEKNRHQSPGPLISSPTHGRRSGGASGVIQTTPLRRAEPSQLSSIAHSPLSEKELLKDVTERLGTLERQIAVHDAERERAMMRSPFDRLYHLSNRRDRDERHKKILQLNRLERLRDHIVSGSLEESIARKEERRRKQEEMLSSPNGVFMRLYRGTTARRSPPESLASAVERSGYTSGRSENRSRRASPNTTAVSSRPPSTARSRLSKAESEALSNRLYHDAAISRHRKEEMMEKSVEQRRQKELEELLIARLTGQILLERSRDHGSVERRPRPLVRVESDARVKLEKLREKDPEGYKKKVLQGRVLSPAQMDLHAARLWKHGYISKARLEAEKKALELKSCTFHPSINQGAGFAQSTAARRTRDKADGRHSGRDTADGRAGSASSGSLYRHQEVDRCKSLYARGVKARERGEALRHERDREVRLRILRGRMENDHHFRRRVELDPSLAERFMKSLVV